MNVTVTGTIKGSARGIEQAVHCQTEAVSDDHEKQSPQNAQVSLGLAGHNGPAWGHGDAAFHQIHKDRAEQA